MQYGRSSSNWEGGSPGSPWQSLLGPRQGGDGEPKNHAAVTRMGSAKQTRGLETPRGRPNKSGVGKLLGPQTGLEPGATQRIAHNADPKVVTPRTNQLRSGGET